MGCDSVYPDRPKADTISFSKRFLVMTQHWNSGLRICNSFNNYEEALKYSEKLAKHEVQELYYIVEADVVWGEISGRD